ncbi:MAG: hypothetical protein MI923_26145 [Phycisphaerales bacterium]|nr:hypothetical protein [Phycisphaerales bacterium]
MKTRNWLMVLIVAVVPFAIVSLTWSDDKTDEKERLEKKFKDMLTGVVLRGTFQMTNSEGLKGKAPMTKPKAERYAIHRISKGLDDNWVITAQVQYMDKDVRVPVPVRVVWAGDTPVITLDKMKIPLLGTYSARVVIHEGFYGGTWSGAGYGGVLSGQIIKADDEKKIEKMQENFKMSMPAKKETDKKS